MATPTVPDVQTHKPTRNKEAIPNLDVPQLQAGGGTAAISADTKVVDRLSPVVSAYIKAVYDDLVKKHGLGSKEGWAKWLAEEQHAPLTDDVQLKDGSYGDFAHYLSTAQSNALQPIGPVDDSHPISNYFISSSHNTYLMGNQLNSVSSVDAYKNVGVSMPNCCVRLTPPGSPPRLSMC